MLYNFKLLGIIGYPLKHTLSPIIHNSVIKRLKLKALYLPFEVKEENFSEAIKGFKVLNFLGFNVTIPYKIRVIPYLDELEDRAKEIGSVNTVVNKEGKLIGYNTDLYGIINPIVKKGWKIKGERVLLIGAGGAALSCIYALKYFNVKDLIIVNRSLDRALNLAKRAKDLNFKVEVFELKEENLKLALKEAKVLFNATPIGMFPRSEESPIGNLDLKNVNYVFDMVYNPVDTKLIKKAKKEGKEVIYGYEMLIEQAKEAFKIWFNSEVDLKLMENSFFKGIKSFDKS